MNEHMHIGLTCDASFLAHRWSKPDTADRPLVQWMILAHPNVPDFVIEEAIQDGREHYVAALVSNPVHGKRFMTNDRLHCLPIARVAVATHVLTCDQYLHIASNPDLHVAFLGFVSDLPVEVLVALRDSPLNSVRNAVERLLSTKDMMDILGD